MCVKNYDIRKRRVGEANDYFYVILHFHTLLKLSLSILIFLNIKMRAEKNNYKKIIMIKRNPWSPAELYLGRGKILKQM